MSLILEALRRSEAERQLGRAPDVLAPMPLVRVARRARRWPWWLALAVLLVIPPAWLGWWQTHHASRGMPVGAAAPAAPASTMPAQISAAPASVLALQVQATAATAAAERDRAASSGAIADKPPKPSRRAAKPLPAAPPMAISLPATVPPATRIAPPIDTGFDNNAGHPAAPSNGAGAPAASADALLSIADLAPAERQALPPLKVSMHVYADRPGDRFMIVDGVRVGEGARIGDRIVLVQIRRDGGVLEIGGRRVLLPKP